MNKPLLFWGGAIVGSAGLAYFVWKRSPGAPAKTWPNWSTPVKATVTSGWGDDRSYRGGLHEGIDLRAAMYTPVRAVAAGVVESVRIGSDGNAGLYVVINHGDGFRTRYLHLAGSQVSENQPVTQNQIIAWSGQSGSAEGNPHLHFDVRASGAALQKYVQAFGHPTPDFPSRDGGYAVPAEPLVPASYSSAVLSRAASRGVMVLA